jgi:hypothetical protein
LNSFREKLFRMIISYAKTYRKYTSLRNTFFRVYGHITSAINFFFRQPGFLNWKTYYNYIIFRGRRVPLRQSNAFEMLQNIKLLHETIGVKLFLRSGTLLGACRQQGFAGRPGDLDFWVLLPNMSAREYIKSINGLAAQFGLTAGPHYHWDGGTTAFDDDEIAIVRLHGAIYADILIFEKIVRDGQFFYSEYLMDGRRGHLPLILIADIENPTSLSIYGLEFCAPANSELLLAEEYGEEWRKPTSRQYN